MPIKKILKSISPKKTKKPEFHIDELPAKYILYYDITNYIKENINIKINERVLRINDNMDMIKEFDLPGEVKLNEIKAEINGNDLIVILPYSSFLPHKVINVPIEIKE